jgi:dTMP kinase
MAKKKGFFVTFESTKEGIGKTTQASLLSSKLRDVGLDVVLTCEPGGTKLGQQIRVILKNPNNRLSKATELFLFLADRAQHYKEVLKPSLKEGKIVISDRYFDTTLAYQGAGRGWKTAFLWRLHHATTGSLLPDVTFVIDGTAHRPLDKNDRLELENDKFYQRAKKALLHLTSKSERYVLLNGNRDEEAIAQEIFEIVKQRLGVACQELPKP